MKILEEPVQRLISRWNIPLRIAAGFPYSGSDNPSTKREDQNYPISLRFETRHGEGSAQKQRRGEAWRVKNPSSGDFLFYGSTQRLKKKITERENRQHLVSGVTFDGLVIKTEPS